METNATSLYKAQDFSEQKIPQPKSPQHQAITQVFEQSVVENSAKRTKVSEASLADLIDVVESKANRSTDFVPFFSRILEYSCSSASKFHKENPNHEGLENVGFFSVCENFRYSIVDSTNIKVQEVGEEPFILEGKEGKRLINVAAQGNLVATLSEDGSFRIWDVRRHEYCDFQRTNGKIPSDEFVRVEMHDNMIIVLSNKIEIIPYPNWNDSFDVDLGKKSKSYCQIEKNGNKIYLKDLRSLHILDLETRKISDLSCEITEGHSINCIAFDNEMIWVADTWSPKNRQLLKYDANGSLVKRLPIDLPSRIEHMVVYGDYMVCSHYENEGRQPGESPWLTIISLKNGKTVQTIKDVLDVPTQIMNSHVSIELAKLNE